MKHLIACLAIASLDWALIRRFRCQHRYARAAEPIV